MYIFYDSVGSIRQDKLKEDVFRAQRMYYLALKLGLKVSPYLRKYSMDILNKYTKMAKSADMKLSPTELMDRITLEL